MLEACDVGKISEEGGGSTPSERRAPRLASGQRPPLRKPPASGRAAVGLADRRSSKPGRPRAPARRIRLDPPP